MEPRLPTQPPPRNELELIDQVGMWANYNFGHLRGPDYGIAEEVGEAIHCVLKRRQMIRGFDVAQIFFEHFTDALADATIYLADYCYIHRCFFKFNRNMQQPQPRSYDHRPIIAHLLQAISQLFLQEEIMVGDPVEIEKQEILNVVVQRICNGLECWAAIYSIDLPMAVSLTWSKVKQRDWRKNSVKG